MNIRELIKRLLEYPMDYKVIVSLPELEEEAPAILIRQNDTQKEIYIEGEFTE